MANYKLAKSLVQLRAQIDALHPDRDKSSDGWIGDMRHRMRKSDHNPNAQGVVTAIDVDEDVSQGVNAMPIVRALQASRDPRIKYIIYEGRITDKNDITKWKPYHGANPHRHHFHISVSSDRGLYDDETPWDLGGASEDIHSTATPEEHLQPELKRGDKGEAVRRLQLALRARGAIIDADGDFGPATERAVKTFQINQNLRPDGIAGRNTNRALGL